MKSASGVGEVFSYFGMNFDVDLAEHLIQQSSRESRVAPRAFLESFVSVAEEEPDENGVTHDMTKPRIDKDHLQNVDIAKPGIVAQVTFKAEKGRPEQHTSILIDGNHRAFKALKEGKEFKVYVLTPEESWRVMAEATYPPLLKHYVNPAKKVKPKKTTEPVKTGGFRYRGRKEPPGVPLTRKTQRLYHGSRKKLPAGTVLLPQSEGYPASSDEDIANTERVLEAHRPAHCLPRNRSVFMVANIDEIEYAGGYLDFVYAVEPVGKVEKNDMDWYGRLACVVWDDVNDPEAARLAENYWSGRPSDHRKNSLFEYRAQAAKIVGLTHS